MPEYFMSKDEMLFIYLHDGPDFVLKSYKYDPYCNFIHGLGYNLVILNYPFCPGQGGSTDLNYVKNSIDRLISKYKNFKIILIGESYGGYLASLLSNYKKFDKIIILSGFISLNYQFIFSSERTWLRSYIGSNDDFYGIIKSNCIKNKIYFIQGEKDVECPIEQFFALKNVQNVKLLVLKEISHKENDGIKLNKVLSTLKNIIVK
ncbi:MAG: DUF2920 family protein [Lactobacillus sp.]|nr:DUF2920 family protein [Lactobacillus sp.]